MTIPGAVSAWAALSQRFGALPFADLFAPAIRYARDGYPVSPASPRNGRAPAPVLPHDLGFAEHFLPRGRAPRAGETFACPPLATTLRAIADTHGRRVLPRRARRGDGRARAGPRRAAHARGLRRAHGRLGRRRSGSTTRGARVHEIPPNGQGIAALMALGILAHFDLAALPPDSVASQHLQIEAMKLAFADVHRYVADPAVDGRRRRGAARPRLPRARAPG